VDDDRNEIDRNIVMPKGGVIPLYLSSPANKSPPQVF
jgi:hypothetical protein